MKEKMYMNLATGSVDCRDGWDYENEDGETVNAVEKGEVVEVYNLNDTWIDDEQYDAAVEMMDYEIRERLHIELGTNSKQVFLDAYCEAHREKYGEDFILN